jgi:DNA-binding NarL/FixJ family response regulator
MDAHSPTLTRLVHVALVDDDDAFREALRGALEEAPGFRCSHAFSSAEEAAQGLSSATVPDVVLMDISLPGRSGLEAVVELKARLPAVEILMLTGHPNEALVFQALVAGASGYLLKSEPVRAILEAIEDVRNGGAPMTSGIARRVIRQFAHLSRVVPQLDPLSGREQQILRLVAEGRLYKEIADHLGLSAHTVRNHLAKIYRKLQVESRHEAARWWRDRTGGG